MKRETSDNIASGFNMSIKSLRNITSKNIEDLESIRKDNLDLTQSYDYLVKELGYSDFYDMCLGTISSEQEKLLKGGNKDFSRLTAVEQTVVRNGKPTKMKIYVDKNKENDNDNELDKDSVGKQPMSSSELNRDYSFGNFDSKATPKKVKDLDNEINGWSDTKGFTSDSNDYLEGRDEEGNLRYLVGITKESNYLKIDFMITDGTISGYWITSFYELLKLALDFKLGVKYPNLNTHALELLATEYNLADKGSHYVADYSDLIEAVGDV